MLKSALLALPILFSIFLPAASQTVISYDVCEDRSIHCNQPDGPNSQKYCCVESNGGYPVFSCCNPYIGLAIGLCVGVPLVIGIIVAIIITCCCCTRYQNKRMMQMAAAYSNRTRNEENIPAPPSYTTAGSSKDTDYELPNYSENDPYACLKPAPTSLEEPGLAEEPTHPQATIQVPEDTTIQVPEDVPLLTDEENN